MKKKEDEIVQNIPILKTSQKKFEESLCKNQVLRDLFRIAAIFPKLPHIPSSIPWDSFEYVRPEIIEAKFSFFHPPGEPDALIALVIKGLR